MSLHPNSTAEALAADASSKESSLGVALRPTALGTASFGAASFSRLSDYAELSKLRIATLVLATVSVGYALGSQDSFSAPRLWMTLIGVTLAAAGSSALNQAWERETDRRMRRTRSRPVPMGRISLREAIVFGIVTGLGGPLLLAVTVGLPVAALTALTVLLYAGVYTPLKPKTFLCTAIGAVPGALPPVLGWVAASGSLSMECLVLFGILFLWQFPHFLAIAWIYRQDYEQGGLKMVPRTSRGKPIVGLLAAAYALALLPVSLLPEHFSMAGAGYTGAALVLGLGYLAASIRFWFRETTETARSLLWTSLIYLPMLLAALAWDHFRLLS